MAMALATVVMARSHIPESAFQGDGWTAAYAGQPMFFFAAGSCYPQSAIANGKKVGGQSQDACIVINLDKGCLHSIPWKEPNTHGVQVPTYYNVKKCEDGNYHVTYHLFWTHDSGHAWDWEWVDVVWTRDGNGNYYQNYIVMEQDSHNAYYPWSSLGSFQNENDKFDSGRGQDRDHPKVYVAKFHHSMWPDECGKNKGTCFSPEFRANDYYMWTQDNANLGHINQIDPLWEFGSDATNPHDTAKDICFKDLRDGGWCG